jgi:hypothetical protein
MRKLNGKTPATNLESALKVADATRTFISVSPLTVNKPQINRRPDMSTPMFQIASKLFQKQSSSVLHRSLLIAAPQFLCRATGERLP